MNNHVQSTIRDIINIFYSTKGYVENGVDKTDFFEIENSGKDCFIKKEEKLACFKEKDREM